MNSISKKVLIKAISVTVPKKVYKLSNILNKKSEKNKIINSSKKFIQKDENILNNNIQKLYK